MSHDLSSEEVAEDYRRALEDLTMNSRYEISNLTVIAKENTEHALAISDALRDHIKRTAPAKKLPALYVLDSVVKNVGTPYTLFFGRHLYSTFMEAYALVDNNTRRKMEEMLKTWKEPVPGSIDTRSVFPIEVTRPIENSLIKFRTSALQAHQEYARSQQQSIARSRPGMMVPPYRNTPTPPNANGARQPQYPHPAYGQAYGQVYPPSSDPGSQPYGQPQYGTPQPHISQPFSAPPSAAPVWQQPQQQQARGFGTPETSIDTLNSDISGLITSSKAAFAQNPLDGDVQRKLKALLDLQSILGREKLPPDQIALIRDQVAQLSIPTKTQPSPQPAALPPAPVTVTQPPVQQPTLASLLGGSDALAALLARASATPQVPTPPPPSVQRVRSPPAPHIKPEYPHVQQSAPPAPVTDPKDLLAKLRAAGILPAGLAVTSTPPLPPNPLANNGNIAQLFPPPPPFLNRAVAGSSTISPLDKIPNDVQLKPISLKIPRPHLISMLYERLGAPCTQCGRRFQADEAGRTKKTAHMDWHFRVHQRMAEAEKRGQHRSWYVDELDWIKSREIDDDHLSSANNAITPAADAAVAPGAKGPKLAYLPVPDDPALANSLCPICQERFEMKWLDDAQEFVWMDAMKVGDRIYHASCYSEAKRDGGSTPLHGRGTPEPVLRKRKNEDEHFALRTKVKTETVA